MLGWGIVHDVLLGWRDCLRCCQVSTLQGWGIVVNVLLRRGCHLCCCHVSMLLLGWGMFVDLLLGWGCHQLVLLQLVQLLQEAPLCKARPLASQHRKGT